MRQAGLKADRALFSSEASADGPYSAPTAKRTVFPTYPFCLPLAHSSENLFPGVRDQIGSFMSKGIPWHKGVSGGPTTHLCSSQVCCLNFLAPFVARPEALLGLVQVLYPEAVKMVPVDPEGEGDYVEFEWIGNREINYLDEGGKGGRTRGANCTSADAAVRYADSLGFEHVVLVEWKYCESYRDLERIPPEKRLLSSKSGACTPSAQTRKSRYEARLNAMVDLPEGVTFDELCVEPLYQLMRQQLLAREMETTGKEAGTVSVLHLAPRSNHDFPRVTSPAVRTWVSGQFPDEEIGVTEAWSCLLGRSERFKHLAVEDFFAPALAGTDEALDAWRDYITARYSWVAGLDD